MPYKTLKVVDLKEQEQEHHIHCKANPHWKFHPKQTRKFHPNQGIHPHVQLFSMVNELGAVVLEELGAVWEELSAAGRVWSSAIRVWSSAGGVGRVWSSGGGVWSSGGMTSWTAGSKRRWLPQYFQTIRSSGCIHLEPNMFWASRSSRQTSGLP